MSSLIIAINQGLGVFFNLVGFFYFYYIFEVEVQSVQCVVVLTLLPHSELVSSCLSSKADRRLKLQPASERSARTSQENRDSDGRCSSSEGISWICFHKYRRNESGTWVNTHSWFISSLKLNWNNFGISNQSIHYFDPNCTWWSNKCLYYSQHVCKCTQPHKVCMSSLYHPLAPILWFSETRRYEQKNADGKMCKCKYMKTWVISYELWM